VFAVASIVTPILLGVVVGAIVSGAVGRAAETLPTSGMAVGSVRPSFAAIFVAPWLSPFPLAMGALALTMFAFLAAVYLALAARDDALRDDFRRLALGAAVAMFVAAFGGLALAYLDAPDVSYTLTTGPAAALQVVTALAGLTALWALWRRRWETARFAAAVQVSLILWGWVIVQYPYIIPPSQTLRDAAAPAVTLRLLLGALIVGAIILIPSLVYLFRTFAGSTAEAE
jgi:cytochrome d ubiquinol oxidase subunit II